MTDGQDLITDRVVTTAKRWEEYDSMADVEPLDVHVECSLRGTVRKVTLVVATGGPHIEVNVTSGTVKGYWGGDSHETHINNGDLMERMHDYYARMFEENILA